MTMTMVGLGWMLTKKITLGRKEGHKFFKPFFDIPKLRERALGNPIWQLSWSCDMELWHFAFYLRLPLASLFKEKIVHSFLRYFTLLLYSKKKWSILLPYLTSCFFIQWRNGPLLCTFVHNSLACVGHCDLF
jgi:hypothetical protein